MEPDWMCDIKELINITDEERFEQRKRYYGISHIPNERLTEEQIDFKVNYFRRIAAEKLGLMTYDDVEEAYKNRPRLDFTFLMAPGDKNRKAAIL